MTSVPINLNSVERVKNFCDKVKNFDFDLEIKSGKYVVDAKSILGILSLNLMNPLYLQYPHSNKNEVENILSDYII